MPDNAMAIPLAPGGPSNPQRSFLPSLGSPVKSLRIYASPSVVVPYLKRLNILDDSPARLQQKTPLITLKLSSTSFLNSAVHESHISRPLYTIKTVGAATVVTRRDPWEGLCRTVDMRWPKRSPTRGKDKLLWGGALLKMANGRWKAAESLLEPAGVFKYVVI
jgi:hypothetical protein